MNGWMDGDLLQLAAYSLDISQFKVSRKLMIAIYYQSNCHLHGCT